VAGGRIVVASERKGGGRVMLVPDTGADGTMVARTALARIGITVPGIGRAEVRGVTGATQAEVLWVDSVEVGTARAGPLAIIAHDADLPEADGLLGRDFLALFSVAIDARANVVTLEPN